MSLSFVFLIKSTPFKKNENIINEIKEGLTAYRFWYCHFAFYQIFT